MELIPSAIEDIVNNVDHQFSSLGLHLNRPKTQIMCICRNRKVEVPAHYKSEIKILGVTFQDNFKWHSHINQSIKKASSRLYPLRCLKGFLNTKSLMLIYTSYIRSILEYASPVFIGLDVTSELLLERLQKRAMYTINNSDPPEIQPLQERRQNQSTTLYKNAYSNPSHSLHHLIPTVLPRSNTFNQPYSRTNIRLNSFIPKTTMLINERQRF